MKSKLILKLDADAMNRTLYQAVEFFKQLESDSLHDVDLEKCTKAFFNSAIIYHKEWFTLMEKKE